MAAALVACGGGGGGGGTPPVQNPGGGPPPATNPPATNPPATNPPATNPPATNPPSTPPPPIGTSSSIIRAEDHIVNGTDNWQSSGGGDSDTGTGGNGGTIDGQYGCVINKEPAAAPVTYHVHAFVGIMVDGKEMAMPDGIGILGADGNEPILAFSCAYNIHTHGASGVIHMEDPAISGTWNSKPVTAPPAKYNLQALLDIWGQSATGLAGGTGLPAVYVGDIDGTKNPATNDDLVNKFTLSTAPLSTILLQHHRAIWLVYGTPPSAGLPQVDFGLSD